MGTDDPRHHDQVGDGRGTAPLATRGLDGRVAETAVRLRLGLLASIDAHGLTRSELVATQRAVVILARSGTAPTLDQFWRHTALPRADVLVRAATALIDNELGGLTTGGGLPGGHDGGVIALCGALTCGPGTAGAAYLTDPPSPAAVATRIRDHLLTALPDRQELDRLGSWWLRRLRRTARARSLPRILWETAPGATLAIADQELYLLDRLPWSYGDRLLSAFELAHADIRRHGRTRIGETADRLARRAPLLPRSSARAGG